MLTDLAIAKFKNFVKNEIAYARYRIGNTYTKVLIHRKEQLPDGAVGIYIEITPQSSSTVTINEVQLIDNNGDVFASKSENIQIASVQEGILYRFAFNITEQEG